MTSPAAPPVAGATVLRVMRWSMRVATLGLLGVGVVRLVTAPQLASWRLSLGLGASVAFVLLYLSGVRPSELDPTRSRNRWWLAALTTIWVALLLLDPDFTWVAFPLFFSHMSLLRIGHALVAIGCMLVVAIATLAHDRGVGGGIILGPTLGAIVAVLVSWGHRALVDESDQHRRALITLRATREELADRNREAGQLTERARLAREIHDTLAQGLSSIVLLSRNATAALDRGDVNAARAVTGRAEQVASENLAEARRFVRDLAPRALASGSLVDALQRLVDDKQAHSPDVVWELRLDGAPRRLPTAVEVALLRSAQASLDNADQHAAATRVVCSLSFVGDDVTLDVVDDGCGFDVTREPGADRFGLRGVVDRVRAAGGTCAIESEPGAGTAIQVAFGLGADTKEDR